MNLWIHKNSVKQKGNIKVEDPAFFVVGSATHREERQREVKKGALTQNKSLGHLQILFPLQGKA
jgi:hypothetical protein